MVHLYTSATIGHTLLSCCPIACARAKVMGLDERLEVERIEATCGDSILICHKMIPRESITAGRYEFIS